MKVFKLCFLSLLIIICFFCSTAAVSAGEHLNAADVQNIAANVQQDKIPASSIVSNQLSGKDLQQPSTKQTADQAGTVLKVLAGLFLLLELALIGYLGYGIIKREREWGGMTWNKVIMLCGILALYLLVLWIIYLIPFFLTAVSWKDDLAWMTSSLNTVIGLSLGVVGMTFFIVLLSFLFPAKKRMFSELPLTAVLSLVAGFANTALVLMITNAAQFNISPIHISMVYAFIFLIYLLGNKYAKTKLVRITNEAVYNLRMELIDKFSATNYQNFESIDRGRIYATLNDDTNIIGNASVMLVTLIITVIIIACVFIYLALTSFWLTVGLFGIATFIALSFYFISKGAEASLEKARDSLNDYLRLINGMMDGFKELSMHQRKKTEYIQDLALSCSVYRDKLNIGATKFVNAAVFGDSAIFILLGFIALLAPALFPGLFPQPLIMEFTMVFLYLIGPVNEIINIAPMVARIKVSWGRIRGLIQDIPIAPLAIEPSTLKEPVETLELEDVTFAYQDEGRQKFSVGPIDFKLRRGQILFIIGGNGSGKTTLAKLITGLYQPHSGKIKINNHDVQGAQLSEYISAVFSDFHLFKKIYSVDLKSKKESINTYLNLLQLDNKVSIEDNSFSTIDLSGGQRKRLALLKCYIEDRPIYLFDEWAADQDPYFRHFFYHNLLQRMKKEGKIIIAITHDDHYFDVADKILKLDFGKIDDVDNDYKVAAVYDSKY